jgi:hypothetical protein|tara:strand:- start:499 stop:834 length:336 start_codon:yes stop_codon:yes gene_type:complete
MILTFNNGVIMRIISKHVFTRENMQSALFNCGIISVGFIKKDGTERHMKCRTVSNDKFFMGGELKGNREHLIEVIDLDVLRKNPTQPTKAWRSINLNSIFSLKIGGQQWIK